MNDSAAIRANLLRRMRLAAQTRADPGAATTGIALLAVSKTRTAAEIRTFAVLGQRAFGENYVQEAIAKQHALADLNLEWHLIGHLQSNKAREAAAMFDWVHSVDRIKLVAALARYRPMHCQPLNVLIQVNIDDEASKSGCRPSDAFAIADAIAAEPRLALRGLMAIPAPDPDMQRRCAAFRALKSLFEAAHVMHPQMDTLSMGMSEDFELAIAEGATMVRVGTALFGPRSRESGIGNRE